MFGFKLNPTVRTLSPSEVSGLVSTNTVTVVDVRERDEWDSGHLPGAIHLPLSDFIELAGSIPRDRRVVFYCRSGGRSARAVAMSNALGLEHDTHMPGGIVAWMTTGFPVET